MMQLREETFINDQGQSIEPGDSVLAITSSWGFTGYGAAKYISKHAEKETVVIEVPTTTYKWFYVDSDDLVPEEIIRQRDQEYRRETAQNRDSFAGTPDWRKLADMNKATREKYYNDIVPRKVPVGTRRQPLRKNRGFKLA